VDEIKLFDELKPPPLPDAVRMHEAVRSRLAAATSAPPTHPGRRRRTMVAVATGAAMVAAGGTGYGLTATHSGPGPARVPAARGGGSVSTGGTVAGLTAVHGCPGMYITAGWLKQVSGAQLVLKPANDTDHTGRDWRAKPVTATTTSATSITRPASGTISDITDGSHVMVQGSWSGRTLVAAQVGIEAALPPASSFAPKPPPLGHGRVLRAPGPKGRVGPPMANGTVTGVHGGSFTVLMNIPLFGPQRIHVITSSATKVISKANVSLSQLSLGANIVVVGQKGPHGVLTASTVTEPSLTGVLIAGGPAKIRPSGCSASAITDAAIQAGG
jgi:hypothetical protein